MSAKKLKFTVDMTCEGCSNAVIRVLGKYKGQGVEGFDVDLPNKTVNVISSLPSSEVLEILKKTGKSTSFIGEESWFIQEYVEYKRIKVESEDGFITETGVTTELVSNGGKLLRSLHFQYLCIVSYHADHMTPNRHLAEIKNTLGS